MVRAVLHIIIIIGYAAMVRAMLHIIIITSAAMVHHIIITTIAAMVHHIIIITSAAMVRAVLQMSPEDSCAAAGLPDTELPTVHRTRGGLRLGNTRRND